MKAFISKLKYVYAFCFFYLPTIAFAKLSDRAKGVSEEGGSIFSELVFWFKVVGGVTFFVAIASFISQKKKTQPITWEVWGIIGGAALVIGLQLLGDTASSMGGSDVIVDAPPSRSGF